MNDHAQASSSIAATEPIGSTGLHRNAGRPFQRLSHGLESDIAIAVGERGWRRLAPAIRRRFANTTECYGTHRYTGVMSTVVRSKMGWLLAQKL